MLKAEGFVEPKKLASLCQLLEHLLSPQKQMDCLVNAFSAFYLITLCQHAGMHAESGL